MHKGSNKEEIAIAGIIEDLAPILADVKLIEKLIATPNAAKSPKFKKYDPPGDPEIMITIPNKAPKIVIIILRLIFSFRNILLIIAAKIGVVLIINSVLATDVNSIEVIKSIFPKA